MIRYWERFPEEPLPLLNLQKALAAYGYNIDPTGEDDEQTRNVVRAFQLHFQPYEVTREMNRESAAILFALLDKYYPEQLDELLLAEAPLDSETPPESVPMDNTADLPLAEPEKKQ